MSKVKRIPLYLILTITSFFSVFPFIWMILGATNSSKDVTQGKIQIGGELMNNFSKLSELIDLPRVFANTATIAISTTIITLLVASLAGYGFEMYRSRIREKIYSFIMLTMMVPFAALLIPLFKIFTKFHLLNSYVAVVVPTVASVFIIFYFRQSTKTFPKDLLQAARVDGLNEFQGFFYIYFPTMKSTYAAAAIMVFMSSWNSYMWPLVILQSEAKKTMTLAISSLSSSYTPDFGVIMLAIIIATLPTLLIFFALQRQFVEGMTGSIK